MNFWGKLPLFWDRAKYYQKIEDLEEYSQLTQNTLGYETLKDENMDDSVAGKEKKLIGKLSGNVLIDIPQKLVTTKQFDIFLKLASAYHHRGAPAPKVEGVMVELTKHYGIESSWFVTPSAIVASFGDPYDINSVTRMVRIGQTMGSIIYLDRIERLMLDLMEGDVLFENIDVHLEEINNLKPYNFYVKLLGSILASCGATVIFYGGGPYELLLSFILGFIVQLNRVYSVRNHFLSITNEFWNSFIASFLATILVGQTNSKVCFAPAVMGAIVWDLPGLGIAMSLRELSQGHTQSGTARLAKALIAALSIAYGILMGTDFVLWVPWDGDIVQSCTIDNNPFSGYTVVLFYPLLLSGFFLLIDAELHHLPGVFLVSFIGLFSTLVLSKISLRAYLHSDIITVIASFLVGVTGRIITRYTKTSSVVYVFAGTLSLLPGGVSVRAIYDLLRGSNGNGQVTGGVSFGIDMMVIAFELAMGSMLSNIIPIKNIGQVKLMQSW